jgi:hypothetical protein
MEVRMTEATKEPTERRRMLAGLTALAGLIVGKLAGSTRVEAAANTSVVGAATADYGVLASPGAAGAPILPSIGSTTHGVIGSNSSLAVVPVGSGVCGARSGSALAGVVGVNASAGHGVYGASNGGNGVYGEIPSTASVNGIGVFGVNSSSYTGGGPGAGGFGLYGHSNLGHGLVGATGTAGGSAIVGATNGVAGAYAGVFYGPVYVGGNFIVVGGAKSAAVPHGDGTYRQLYCVESPESWFEDFGTAQLVEGKADVAIEPGFGAVAEMDSYHVFLTGYDHDHLLHVSKRTPNGFTVEANAALAALQGRKECDLTGEFSWRVVAKRKDITGERLAKVVMPPAPVLPPTTIQRRNTGERER